MAVYDPESKKLILRVVYDGPGMAGKTTNLQQLYSLFAPQRRSELYTGTTADSRTLCLDWMQFDGGLVRGHDLRCHLLTVPGQEVLARRRQMLLSMADTVVFVLESTEAGLEDALPMWRSLLAWTGGPEQGVPIVVQANKQDVPAALNARQIRERWALDASIPISMASAANGEGVRETVVLAIRGAAVLLQELLATANLDELKGTYEGGQDLERSILAAERSGAATPGDSPRQPLSEAAAAALSERPVSAEASAEGVVEREWTGEITLPSVDAPAGLVWPALDGRKTLRRVPFLEATRHDSPVSPDDRADHRKEPIIYEAGIWCLRTSLARRFGDAEQAREALVRLAHRKLALGTLCVPRTALVAQRSADDAYWLWTISMWLSPLSSQLEYAVKSGDEGTLSEALSHYARLIIRALRLCLDSNVVLNLHPRSFGVLYDQGFYLDDELGSGTENTKVGRSILRRFDEYAGYPGALRVYAEVLLHELGAQIHPAELTQLGLGHALEETVVKTDAGRHAKDQLLQAVSSREALPASERRSEVNET